MNILLRKIVYSFPVQLVFQHIKSNQILLMAWVFLVLVVTKNFGMILGIPYLFLDPEYLNRVHFLSFFIVGSTYGFLVVSFNITCYILYGSKYAFVGVVSSPFTKFSINNSLIPIGVLIVYLVSIVRFQLDNEFTNHIDLIFMLLGFIAGLALVVVLLYSYFGITNKDIFHLLANQVDKRLKKVKLNRLNALRKFKESKKKEHFVEYYFDTKLKLRSTQGLLHFYDKESVLKVFDQNHVNAVIVQAIILILLLLSGVFIDIPYFQIPAAASSIMLFTIGMIVTGAIAYWFRGWMNTTFIAIFIIVNILFKSGAIVSRFEAIGVDYQNGKAPFDLPLVQLPGFRAGAFPYRRQRQCIPRGFAPAGQRHVPPPRQIRGPARHGSPEQDRSTKTPLDSSTTLRRKRKGSAWPGRRLNERRG